MADAKGTVLWARWSVHHTRKTCALSCLLPLVALGLIVALRLFKLSEAGGTEYFIKSDRRSQLEDARAAARRDFPYAQRRDAPRARKSTPHSFFLLLRGAAPGSKNRKPVAVDVGGGGPNMLTREGLAFLKASEDAFAARPGFEKYCWDDLENRNDCAGRRRTCALPESVTNHPLLYGKYDGARLCDRVAGSAPVSQEQFDKFMESLFPGGKLNPAFSVFMGKDLTASSRSTQILRSIVNVGMPFANSTDTAEKISEEQVSAYNAWSAEAAKDVEDRSNSQFFISIFGEAYSNGLFGTIILRDLSFAGFSIVLVFITIWIHTTSAVLAGFALLQILAAFPLTFIVYRGIFQITYFAALQIMTIFLILGIGADDVFVFTDAWKQSAVILGPLASLEDRMSWTYRRAVKAMAVTSFTTAVAFFVTATSPVMPISTLGVWAGMLVLLLYVLVITLYPCGIIFWYRFWRVRSIRSCFRTPKSESEGTNDSDESPAEQPRGFAKVMSFFRKSRPENEYRPIEKFFNGPWTNWMNIVKLPVIVLGVALIAVSIYLGSRLRPPNETEAFFPDDHPISVQIKLLTTAFPVRDASQNVRVKVIWGLHGIDRKGTSKYDPTDIGKAVLDPNFSLRSAKAQQRVLDACNYFKNERKDLLTQEKTISSSNCWIKDFQTWQKSDQFNDYASEKALAQDIVSFGEYKDELGLQPYMEHLVNQRIAFNGNRTKVVFTELSFVSGMRAESPYAVMYPEYEKWIAALANFNAETKEASVNKPLVVGGVPWLWMMTQKALIDNMFIGIGVVFAVALIALTVSTGNWIVSLLALLCIAGILTNLLALLSLFGWSLGITESIGVVIAIGFSFDFVAHLANAFVESKSDSRFERTRDALTDLGISIFAGAVSTLLAGSMLFFATIIFFVKFGFFVVATVGLSLLWGLAFFACMLLAIGPTGNTGNLFVFFRSCLRKKADSVSEADTQA